ncbi:unnamed protein product, partial [Rotaria sp. Silwood2]
MAVNLTLVTSKVEYGKIMISSSPSTADRFVISSAVRRTPGLKVYTHIHVTESGRLPRTKFKFEREGLIKRIIEWKKSLSTTTTPVSSSSSGQPSLSQDVNPLISLANNAKATINTGHIESAMLSLAANSQTNVPEMAQNYLSAINTLETFGEIMVPPERRIYYRCKACNQV